MKKVFVIAITVFTFIACDKENSSVSTVSKDYSTTISALNKMHIEGISNAGVNFKSVINVNKTQDNLVSLNQSKLVANTLKFYEGKYFTTTNNDFLKIADNFKTVNLPEEFFQKQGRVSNFNMNSFEHFSSKQKDIAEPFINELLNSENPSLAKQSALNFQLKVTNSSLITDDEKLELLALSSATIAFSDFANNGGVELIRNALADELGVNDTNPNGRIRGCSVNWRSVWAGAVIGAGVGAVYGAKAGCAGGMVAGPIGAASGCVGGGVMGGASGFVSGAVTGVASELLTSCFR
jgi:hypothetical protein